MSTRLFLKKIRQSNTLPSTILFNGYRADKTAFEYVKSTLLKRNSKKRKMYHLTKKNNKGKEK